jgi:hypothetical protein
LLRRSVYTVAQVWEKGLGFDVSFDVSAQPNSAQPNGMRAFFDFSDIL